MSLFKSINCNPLLFSCTISNICGNFNSSQNFYFSICFNIFTDIFVSSLSFLCYSSSFSFCFLFFFCKLAFFPAILCLLILCLFHREYFLSNISMQSQDFRSLLDMCIEIRKIVDGLPNLTIFLLMASDHPAKSFTADFEYIYFLTSGHFSLYVNWMARSTIPWPLGVFSLATVFQCHPSVEQLWRGFSFLTYTCLSSWLICEPSLHFPSFINQLQEIPHVGLHVSWRKRMAVTLLNDTRIYYTLQELTRPHLVLFIFQFHNCNF